VISPCTRTQSIHIVPCLTHLQDLLKRVNVLVTLSWLPQRESDVPNIDFIQFISAGTNHVAQHPIYTDTKIPLCSANGVHGPQIAEWVLMMDLIHNHNYIDLYKKQQKKEWKHDAQLTVRDNVGRTVGILGYGSIGRQGESVFRLCMSRFCLA
jgi:phosphoglycerate dehydrogenase-like enzyme